MASVTFDTLKFAKKLESAGIAQAQAEAIAEAIAEAFSEATSQELVTRDYLDAKLESTKNDILKFVAAALIAQAGLIAALVKLL